VQNDTSFSTPFEPDKLLKTKHVECPVFLRSRQVYEMATLIGFHRRYPVRFMETSQIFERQGTKTGPSRAWIRRILDPATAFGVRQLAAAFAPAGLLAARSRRD
jgi:hypothetical protein